ncbi:hypothetical protein SPSF3K_01347 [Streptococcus parauberis]|uniref:YdhG-like domain-containing protein n=1 Tax=Streptococcus parauberis KRS-02083 TaxID=1207545 RepID=A0ABN0ISZ7_9STRE|nr:DUF1801 domain-containing protein [Streptococcus parauberis]AUT06072.1 hypothetical protein SPSF3K_01347 [Streptococcus parauberis]EMG26031.1 hypothetical protein SPJ1_0708 [Streptococcus parauberis KRS-02083]UWV09471.1 DUF1801 domain-containing protein [Streptococcus parauberis]WEM62188.1 DUF1801 domain-containing protein [Streptococcus parauberis]WEM64175.1 DUF1801 domain-containing protein [Streptococcus parauberis]
MQYQVDSIEDYLQALPDDRRDVINQLRQVIKDNLPDKYEEKLQYQMISYVVPHDVFPEGYHCNPEDNLAFITIGSQKNHIAIYHNGIYMFDHVKEWFLTQYPLYMKTKPDMGKSCIRFKNMKTIPYELIGKLCQQVSQDDLLKAYQKTLK